MLNMLLSGPNYNDIHINISVNSFHMYLPPLWNSVTSIGKVSQGLPESTLKWWCEPHDFL